MKELFSKISFSKKNIILGIAGICVIASIILLTLNPQIQKFNVIPVPTPVIGNNAAISPVPKTAVLSLKQQSSSSIAVVLDTQGKPVSGVQIELSYDPNVLKDISVTPGTFFSNP